MSLTLSARRRGAASPDPLTPGRGKRRALMLLAFLLLFNVPLGVVTATSASAHPLSASAILLDIGSDDVSGEIQLPIDRLAIALDESLTAETVVQPEELAQLRQYVQEHIAVTGDGGDWDVAVTGGSTEVIDDVDHLVFELEVTPSSGAVTDFTLQYDAIVEHLLSHRTLVSARAGTTGEYTSVGLIDWSDQELPVAASDYSPDPVAGFFSSVRLGFAHIVEGADHLLFLFMLLLPAPLLARRGRWVRSDDLRRDTRHVVHVVTAFAIGHSITLALGALGLVELPIRVVEGLIALSVVVSGIHAIRPLVAGGEAWIAGVFGLMHGLAFATLLTELDLGRQSLLADLVGFNIGIELTQLAVVALVMPSLVLLSRTPAYTPVRLVLAGFGIVLAGGWLAERLGLIPANPLEFVADALIEYPFVFVGALAVLAAIAWLIAHRRVPAPVTAPPIE